MLNLGIDFGFDHVKIAAVKHGPFATSLAGTYQLAIPAQSITKNGLEHRDALAEVVKQALEKGGLPHHRGSRVTTALPAGLVLTKRLELPAMSPRELAQSIAFEVGQSFPIPAEELIVDWLIVPNPASTAHQPPAKDQSIIVLLVGAPRALVTSFTQLFDQLGLDLLGLEIKPIANARAVTTPHEKTSFLLVDIGAVESSIAVIDRGAVSHVTSLGFGANQMHHAPSLAEKISSVIPADLLPPTLSKTKSGSPTKKPKSRVSATRSNLEETIKPLAQEITSLVKYSAQHLGLTTFHEIRLCGGGAQAANLASVLTDQTGMSTTLANPLVRLAPTKALAPSLALPFTTAIGLALQKDFV